MTKIQLEDLFSKRQRFKKPIPTSSLYPHNRKKQNWSQHN